MVIGEEIIWYSCRTLPEIIENKIPWVIIMAGMVFLVSQTVLALMRSYLCFNLQAKCNTLKLQWTPTAWHGTLMDHCGVDSFGPT